jgi:hypothetical protein
MRLVMTLLVRDEEDVLESHLSFHLHAGVDAVIVTDNGSVDGTAGILDRFARDGAVHVIHEPAGAFRQREWVTRMARLAATDFGADWVINSDADEFWWPRGGSLKDVLEAIPGRYGIVQAFVRHFVPSGDGDDAFAERMVYRLSPEAPVNDPTSPWRPFRKVLHRADPTSDVIEGSHALRDSSFRPLRGWYPIEVLHFPIRSPAQFSRKGAVWASAVEKYYGGARVLPGPGTAYHALAHRATDGGRSDEYYASLALDDTARERALDEGVLQVDTRLRDAIRALRKGEQLYFPRPGVADDARFAVDAAVLGEGDVIRAQRRLDELEQRLADVEGNLGIRVERRLRSLVRRRRAT